MSTELLDYDFRIAIIGNARSGKTEILKSLVQEPFSYFYEPTIGIDCRYISFILNQHRIRLRIWEMSGRTEFRSMSDSFFRGVDGLIIVSDSSLNDVDDWYQLVYEKCGKCLPCVIAINKNDEIQCQVDNTRILIDGDPYIEALSIPTFLVSASRRMGINEMIVHLTQMLTPVPEKTIVAPTPEKPKWWQISF